MSWLDQSAKTYGSKKLSRSASTASVSSFARTFSAFSARNLDENAGFQTVQNSAQRSPLRPTNTNSRGETPAQNDDFSDVLPVTGKRQRGDEPGTRAKQRASLTSPINLPLSALSLESPHCDSPTFSEGSNTEKKTLKRTSSKRKNLTRRAKGPQSSTLSKYSNSEIETLQQVIQASENGSMQHGIGAALAINLSRQNLSANRTASLQQMLEALGFEVQVFGTEILYCLASVKVRELRKALSLHDVQIKRQQAENEVPAADLTAEMQMSAHTTSSYHQPHRMSAIAEAADGSDDDDEAPMQVHQSARKPRRRQLYRSSDEHSPATPTHHTIQPQSTNSAATIADTPSPEKAFGRRSNFSRHGRIHTASTDTSLESNEDGSDDEIHQLTEGLEFTSASPRTRSACSSRNSLLRGFQNLHVQSDIMGETPQSEHDISYRGVDLSALQRSPMEVTKLRFSLGLAGETPGRVSGGPQDLHHSITSPIISPTKGFGGARFSAQKLSMESSGHGNILGLPTSPTEEDDCHQVIRRRGKMDKNRLRRSHSMPNHPSTPCSDYRSLTQNGVDNYSTCFKTPVQFKQTGLRRTNDWGISQASNTESIKRLSGRLQNQSAQATDLLARMSAQSNVALLKRGHTIGPTNVSQTHPYAEHSNYPSICVPQASPVLPLASPITPVQPAQSFASEAATWLLNHPSPTADTQNREALAKRLGASPSNEHTIRAPTHSQLEISQVSVGSLDLSISNVEATFLGESEQERRRTRLQRTRAKLKRMSMAKSARSIEQLPSFSPPVAAAKSKEGRRSSVSGSRRRQSSHASSSGGLFGVSAKTFTAIVIGGEYQQCFEADRPVITPCSSNGKRVVRARIANDSLEMELYIPKDKTYKHITWDEFHVYKVAPLGVIVARAKILPNQRQVCYFIQADPRRATIAGNELKFSPPAQPRKRLDDMPGLYTHAEADEETEEEEEDGDAGAEVQMECQDSSIYHFDDTDLAEDSVDADWCQSIVLSSVFEFLPPETLGKCVQVCKAWNLNTWRIAVRQHYNLTDEQNVNLILHESSHWTDVMRRFNWGRYLAEGAYKTVYQVADSSASQRTSAVSVMDLDSLWARDEGVVATHELRVSLLVSQLAQMSICANFLRTTDCFRCEYPPHKQLWGSSDEPCPQGEYPPVKPRARVPKQGRTKGDYVYIHMELCEGGDVEEYMRKLPTKTFDPVELPALIFQMLFSLYSSRDILGMRHYDVKLLNFLLARPEGTDDSFGKPPAFLYHFADRLFWLPFRDNSPRVVKLADFGTAVIDRETLGTELDVDQFTTLENSPIEYLLQGSAARQAYAADTFALGLAVLHLFTGEAPYEEILHDVYCPEYLVDKLQEIWREDDPNYGVIARVIDSLVDDDDDDALGVGSQSDSPRYTLYHTLYRYLVLFGLPEREEMEDAFPDNPVVRVLYKTFAVPTKSRSSKEREARAACCKQLETDRAKYSLDHGSCAAMVRARDVMQKLPGARELLLALCEFDPSKRTSMHAALQSPLFELLQPPATPEVLGSQYYVHEFSHYRAPQVDALPIV